MYGDGDLVLLAKLVEAVETIHVGIGAQIFQTQCRTKLKELFVGIVILAEVGNTKTGWSHIVFFAQSENGLDLLRVRVRWDVFGVELTIFNVELFEPLQCRLKIVLPESIALNTKTESQFARSLAS